MARTKTKKSATQKAERTPRQVIRQLLQRGWNKWQIKKALRVGWNTVHRWSEGDQRPTQRHADSLRELLNLPVPKREEED